MKIIGIVLIIGILFVAAVIARNRKAEAERKERRKHVFDDYEGAAAPKAALKPEPKPAPTRAEINMADTRTPEEIESERKIEAAMEAWRASRTKEDQEYFNRKMDQAKRKN